MDVLLGLDTWTTGTRESRSGGAGLRLSDPAAAA